MSYTIEETKENRKKWINALRSKRYQQTQLQLANKDLTAFCCLGVACDISELGQWQKLDTTSRYSTEHGSKSGSISTLPKDVQEWLGLSDEAGTYSYSDQYLDLVRANDIGVTFAEIADIIESEPEGLVIDSLKTA